MSNDVRRPSLVDAGDELHRCRRPGDGPDPHAVGDVDLGQLVEPVGQRGVEAADARQPPRVDDEVAGERLVDGLCRSRPWSTRRRS